MVLDYVIHTCWEQFPHYKAIKVTEAIVIKNKKAGKK